MLSDALTLARFSEKLDRGHINAYNKKRPDESSTSAKGSGTKELWFIPSGITITCKPNATRKICP